MDAIRDGNEEKISNYALALAGRALIPKHSDEAMRLYSAAFRAAMHREQEEMSQEREETHPEGEEVERGLLQIRAEDETGLLGKLSSDMFPAMGENAAVPSPVLYRKLFVNIAHMEDDQSRRAYLRQILDMWFEQYPNMKSGECLWAVRSV